MATAVAAASHAALRAAVARASAALARSRASAAASPAEARRGCCCSDRAVAEGWRDADAGAAARAAAAVAAAATAGSIIPDGRRLPRRLLAALPKPVGRALLAAPWSLKNLCHRATHTLSEPSSETRSPSSRRRRKCARITSWSSRHTTAPLVARFVISSIVDVRKSSYSSASIVLVHRSASSNHAQLNRSLSSPAFPSESRGQSSSAAAAASAGAVDGSSASTILRCIIRYSSRSMISSSALKLAAVHRSSRASLTRGCFISLTRCLTASSE